MLANSTVPASARGPDAQRLAHGSQPGGDAVVDKLVTDAHDQAAQDLWVHPVTDGERAVLLFEPGHQRLSLFICQRHRADDLHLGRAGFLLSHARTQCLVQALKQGQVPALHEHVEPVSYTHLTLPTIYSV